MRPNLACDPPQLIAATLWLVVAACDCRDEDAMRAELTGAAPAGAGAAAVLASGCEWIGYGHGSVVQGTCQPMPWLAHAALLCADLRGRPSGMPFANQVCSPDGTEAQLGCCFGSEPPPPTTPLDDPTITFATTIVPTAGPEAARALVLAEAERRCGGAISDRMVRYADPLLQSVRAMHFSCRK